MTMPGRNYNAGSGYRYGFNGKELDKEVASTTTYDYGFRIYSPALGKFLSVDPLTKEYPWYTPYQFAGNKTISCIDLDGLEESWRITQNYRCSYYPVLDAPNVLTGVGNAIANVGSFAWNGTIGGVLELGKSAWNTVGETVTGKYKSGNPDVIYTVSNTLTQTYNYHKNTPVQTQFKDFLNEATNLTNYEMIPSLIIGSPLIRPKALISSSTIKIPLADEVFTNSIKTRSLAEVYAENVTYKNRGYFNANSFIKSNNEAFDLISTIERTIVDVASTSKNKLIAGSWEKNKLKRLASPVFKPQGFIAKLQLYIKEGKYTAEQIADYKKSLDDMIKKEGLKDVEAAVDIIPNKK